MDKLKGRGWAMGWLKNEGKGGGPPGQWCALPCALSDETVLELFFSRGRGLLLSSDSSGQGFHVLTGRGLGSRRPYQWTHVVCDRRRVPDHFCGQTKTEPQGRNSRKRSCRWGQWKQFCRVPGDPAPAGSLLLHRQREHTEAAAPYPDSHGGHQGNSCEVLGRDGRQAEKNQRGSWSLSQLQVSQAWLRDVGKQLPDTGTADPERWPGSSLYSRQTCSFYSEAVSGQQTIVKERQGPYSAEVTFRWGMRILNKYKSKVILDKGTKKRES